MTKVGLETGPARVSEEDHAPAPTPTLGGDGSITALVPGDPEADALAETATPAPLLPTELSHADMIGAGTAESLPAVATERYMLGSEIGRGGIGRVVRAKDRVLDRTIAIKELHSPDAATRRRFVREALITARLQHPSVVPIYEAGRRDGAPFYAMKLVAGKTLGAAIAGARTLAERLALVPNVLAVADAIAYAHEHAIVHRDLKPQNVMLGGFGETVVIDWGLAKDLRAHGPADDDDPLASGPYRNVAGDQTVEGALLGTPAYMAPEQASGGEVDERADVYALGAMLYHVIAGVGPHRGVTSGEMIANLLDGAVVPVAVREPDVPLELATIVGKAMAHAPGRRYPSARELADDLRRFQTGQLVAAHRYTFGERLARWLRRYRVWTVVAIALVVLFAYGAWSLRAILIERGHAATNHNRTVLEQAREALRRDPAEALAWLRRFDPRGEGWESARVLAGGAMARPLPDLVVPDAGRNAELIATGGRFALLRSGSALRAVDLITGVVQAYAISPSGPLVVCTDGKRVVGHGPLADSPPGTIAIDLATGAVAREPATRTEAQRKLEECSPRSPYLIDGLRILAWDAAAGQLRPVGDFESWNPMNWLHTVWDGQHALSHHADGTVIRWSRTGTAQRSTVPLWGPVSFSDDGRLVVTAGGKQRGPVAYDFSSETATDLDEKLERGDRLTAAPNGTYIVVTGKLQTRIRRVGGVGGKTGRTIDFHAPSLVAISGDSGWILLGNLDEVVLVELASPQPLRLESAARITAAVFDRDTLLTIDAIGTLRRYRLPKREPVPGGRTIAAARSVDGGTLVTATESEIVRVGPDGKRSTIPMVGTSGPIRLGVNWAGDVAIGRFDGLWQWRRDGVVRSYDAFTMTIPVGTYVAWAGERTLSWYGNGLEVFDGTRLASKISVGNYLASGPVPQAHVVAISPDHRWVTASHALKDDRMRTTVLFDLEQHRSFPLAGSRTELAMFSHDGARVATGTAEGELVVWDVATQKRTAVVGHTDARTAIAMFNRDGTQAIGIGEADVVIGTVGADPRNARTLPLPVERGIEQRICHAALSLDGSRLVVGASSSTDAHCDRVYVCDLWTGEVYAQRVSSIALTERDHTVEVLSAYATVQLEHQPPAERDAFIAWLAARPYRLDRHSRLTTGDGD